MRIIIVGCGRVGTATALELSRLGHQVAVVDHSATAFARLGQGFGGLTVTGVGFDREVLLKAGIERADGLAAVTSSDEANVVAARIAREVFHVPRVVARVYDPRQAEIYHRLGLLAVSPVAIGSLRLVDLLTYSHLDAVLNLGGGEVSIVETEIPALLAGRAIRELIVQGEIHVVAITRGGKTFLPTPSGNFQAGDIVHLAVLAKSGERLKQLLGLA